MKCSWLLFCFFYCLASSACTWAVRSEDDVRWVLEQLRDTFREFRQRTQYAAMYLPPPNYPRRRMTYLPRPDFAEEGGIVYPVITRDNQPYRHNFVTVSTDYQAQVYGDVLNRHDTIHSEDLMINLVYPRMGDWYVENFRQGPNDVYLFTHFLPCPNCFEIIQRFINQNTNLRVYIGYTDLYGGNRDGNPDGNNEVQRQATRERRDSLARFLFSVGGMLIQLANAYGVCGQRGSGRRAKRDSANTCPLATEDREFIITMDFSNGYVKAIFSQIPSLDNQGWIGLFDEHSNRLAWVYTYHRTNGFLILNHRISNGMHLAYFQENSNSASPVVTSLKWFDCGFSHKMLNKVPWFEEVGLKLTIDDGTLVVKLTSIDWPTFNRWDWIAIQTIDQISHYNNYLTWFWVASMTRDNGYTRSYRIGSLSSDYAKGFRAKFVLYDDYQHVYLWHGLYDNTTPLWTPDGCRGTLSID